MNEETADNEFDEDIPENAEPRIFAKIIRYMADQLSEIDPDAVPEDLGVMGELFVEIADAFEATGGFEFTHEQALPLSHAFSMLEGGIRLLAEQASEGGHTNAAAKMEWAAIKAKAMTADLETSHLEGAGGIIVFDRDDEESPAANDLH